MEDLISKREVLERYGISYGALYRWKRMGLIPEDWFIKKSTVTGQETFFQREQICRRVELILAKKVTTSLEELAEELVGRQQERQSQRKLCIQSEFFSKVFSIEELKSVVLTDGEREIDLLDYLREVSL